MKAVTNVSVSNISMADEKPLQEHWGEKPVPCDVQKDTNIWISSTKKYLCIIFSTAATERIHKILLICVWNKCIESYYDMKWPWCQSVYERHRIANN